MDDGINCDPYQYTGIPQSGARTENLNRVLVGKQVDDFEGVGNDADCHLFLTYVATMSDERQLDLSKAYTVVAAVHHETAECIISNVLHSYYA